MINENKIIITKDDIYKLNDKYLKRINLKEDRIFNKAVEVVILDEDMYIETIEIPRCKIKIMDNIIQNYIKEKFLNWDELLFNYAVIKKDSKNYKVKFYCINSKELTKLRCIGGKIKIKKISIFQTIIRKEGNRLIKDKEYIIYSLFKNKIYILFIFNGVIMSQSVLNIDECSYKNVRQYIDNVKLEYLNIKNDINIWQIDFNLKFKPINLKKYKSMEEICLDIEEEESFQFGIS